MGSLAVTTAMCVYVFEMHACAYPSVCACKYKEQTTRLYSNRWINIRENRRRFSQRKRVEPLEKNIANFLFVDMRIGMNNIVWCVCLYLGLFLFCLCACMTAMTGLYPPPIPQWHGSIDKICFDRPPSSPSFLTAP